MWTLEVDFRVDIKRSFLFTPSLIGIKYPKQITLYDTNTVIFLIIVIKTDK